jgi:hypothetical protein
MRTGFVARFALGCLIAAGTFSARAQDPGQAFPARRLAADDGLLQPAVVLVMPNGAEHVGFIINRVTRTTVAARLSRRAACGEGRRADLSGRPDEHASAVRARAQRPGEGSRRHLRRSLSRRG